MSMVIKRYRFVDANGYPAQRVEDSVKGSLYVAEADFDTQRLRADTAEAERDALRYKAELYDEVWADATGRGYANVTMALCALTAAEQRNADMGATLAGALKLLRGVHTGDLFGPDDWETVNSFLISAAALNPNPEAESYEAG